MGIREDSLANKEIKKAKKLRNPENAQKSIRYEETSIKVIKIFTQDNCWNVQSDMYNGTHGLNWVINYYI